MVHEAIEAKLSDYFEPAHLEVINESYMHNVPEGSESHFKVIIVSEKFTGQRLIGRHRQVNQFWQMNSQIISTHSLFILTQ